MPRINRQTSSTKVYHIILRGIDKQDIFLGNNDYQKFLEIIKETKEKYEFDIYAYCLMTNHVHIIIYDKEEKISKIMQSIEIKYSMYFNKKYDRVGHLFQDRFLSKEIENRQYLKTVCRYIHQNPLKAGIEKTENYKWSSYNEYIKKSKIVNTKMLLLIFSQDKDEAKEEFIKFHKFQSNQEIYEIIEYELKEKLTDEQLLKYICKFLMMQYEEIRQLLSNDKEKRQEIIRKCKNIKGITNRQLSRVLGINRKIIDRIK